MIDLETLFDPFLILCLFVSVIITIISYEMEKG